MDHQERISEILGRVPDNIVKLENLKSFSYVVDNSNKKYFFKFSKKSKVDKEKFGIAYFKKLGLETPKIVFEGEDYLVTRFEENLGKINTSGLMDIVRSYQKRYRNISSPVLIPSKFSRNRINNIYLNNKDYFLGFKTNGLAKILNEVNEEAYQNLPRIIAHGDIHNKNVFLTQEGNPFILDFENMCSNYPTFDISTAIFYALGDSKEILNNYLEFSQKEFDMSRDKLINLIIADTLRIAIWDTFYLKKKKVNEETMKKRTYNNGKVFDLFL